MKKVVGKVTEEEKLDIMGIYNHKKSLEELMLVLPKEDGLYMEASRDMKETEKKYQEWWRKCYEKYHWERGEKDWDLLFETNEIIIKS